MQVKTTPSSEEKIKKQFQSVQIGFIKQGTTLYKFCKENRIDKAYAFRALRGQRTGEKAQQLRQRLIDASKGKTDFLTEQSSSTTEEVKHESVN